MLKLMRYRMRPVVIQAVRWEGRLDRDLVGWLGDSFYGWGTNFSFLRIRTPEGHIDASPGDYIIQGVAGEFYPCKPDIFRNTYEAA